MQLLVCDYVYNPISLYFILYYRTSSYIHVHPTLSREFLADGSQEHQATIRSGVTEILNLCFPPPDAIGLHRMHICRYSFICMDTCIRMHHRVFYDCQADGRRIWGHAAPIPCKAPVCSVNLATNLTFFFLGCSVGPPPSPQHKVETHVSKPI